MKGVSLAQSLPKACFNVCTGDIEDAPAINSLHSFRAHVENGKIFVTAREQNTLKANMAQPPALSSVGIEVPGDESVVIVGGGAGAIHAIESLRLARVHLFVEMGS